MDDSPANRERVTATTFVDFGSPETSVGTPRPIRIRIPSFPTFKPLALDDQYEIEQWVKLFPPYSDFNFVSLWSWNTSGGFEISWLNDNLVVLFNDYGTGERFLSFIGRNAGVETAFRLLEYARERQIAPELRLLPEETAISLANREGIEVTPAPHHRDYILSVPEWCTLAGGQFRNKRYEISCFERDVAPECRQIDLSNRSIQQAMTEVFGRWVIDRERGNFPATVIESLAVRRIFTLHRPGDLLAMGLFVHGALVGYSINERLPNGYAMGHHSKVAGNYSGAYALMLRQTCRQLASEGFSLINIQQDLGEPGLALAKRLYRPQNYLFKYQVARTNVGAKAISDLDVLTRELPAAGMIDSGWMDEAHGG